MPIASISRTDFKPKRATDIARILNRKIPLTSDAFDTLVAEQRARAFRIAGVNKASLIRQAQNEISKAIRDRTPLRDVRIRLLQLFEDAGVDAPNMNHLRTVMRMNMNTVDAVARNRVLKSPAVLRHFPFWKYVTVRDGGVRPTHAALDGKVFRADDPFWDKYDPPWEWGCRCSKIPVSRRELKRLGIELSTEADARKVAGPPDPEFAFPRDQLKTLDRTILKEFSGDLRKFLDRRFSEADRMEQKPVRSP